MRFSDTIVFRHFLFEQNFETSRVWRSTWTSKNFVPIELVSTKVTSRSQNLVPTLRWLSYWVIWKCGLCTTITSNTDPSIHPYLVYVPKLHSTKNAHCTYVFYLRKKHTQWSGAQLVGSEWYKTLFPWMLLLLLLLILMLLNLHGQKKSEQTN